MFFLLDTNVVSETGKVRPHGGVLAWMNSVPLSSIFISAMTVGEIQAGIERTRESDTAKSERLERWLSRTIETSQILPMDHEVAIIWARFMHRQPSALASDAWIAATAQRSNLIVVTRNTRDFANFAVPIFNPFEDTRPRKAS